MKKIYIIDASGFLFRSYFAIRNITNAKGESTNALFGFIRSVMKLFKDFHPEHVVAVFDGPNNAHAREAIYPEYKAHRSSMPPDLGYQIDWARDFCDLIGIPQLNIPKVEADDTMGSVARYLADHGFTSYLCTSDKDFCQLVNHHVLILNTHKDNLLIDAKEVENIYGIKPEQMIDYLAIVGDASDNVPGIPGMGPKTASALLKEFGTLDNILQNADKIGGKKGDLIEREKEHALLSRKLVIIDTQVAIPHDPEFYHLKPAKREKLKEFYQNMNFNSLLRELEEAEQAVETHTKPVMEEDVKYHLVDDEKALNQLLNLLSSKKEVCFRIEPSVSNPMRASLVGMAFSVKEKEAYYVPLNGALGQQKVIDELKPLFENPKIGFFGHNVKCDLEVLANAGIKVANICFDTILASYLLNSHSRQHSLEHLALEYFSKVLPALKELTGKGKKEIPLKEVPIEKLCRYSCEAVDLSFRLKQLLEPQLTERKLSNLLYEIELPLVSVLAEMEKHGIYADVDYLNSMAHEVNQLLRAVEKEIYTLAGEEFNLNSPKQLSHILFTKMGIKPPKKTATGLSTNADVLEVLKDEHPLAGKLLEYRALEKLRSTYIEALPIEVNPHSHRIHCNFNQTVAATGRLACQEPNLQNIPVRTDLGRKIRGAFRPQKQGWSYLSADYSQIELRLLAHLSKDPTLIEAFRKHEDIHASTAANVMNIPLEQVTRELRYQAKAVNFGIVYGQQAYGLSQELGIDVKEAAHFIERYFNKYEKVKEYIEHSKLMTRKTGKAVTMTSRERLIPEIHSQNYMIRSAAERLAINTPLQGTAADLIKMAMIQIDKEIRKHHLKTMMILQIHDELLFEVPDEELPTLEKLVKRIMEGVMHLDVPLVVDISIGKNWEEC